MVELTRHSPIADWVEAGRDQTEPDCPFIKWASTRLDHPAEALSEAPKDVILSACMAALTLPENADRKFFVKLVYKHSTSKAVKRWAAHG